MSTYKSYAPRRPTEPIETIHNDRLRDKVEKLQELFPNWSYEDLQSVLTETVGDVELAVVRISEGHAEQWGSVTRKKDKKNAQSSQSSSSFLPRGDRDRHFGEFRGGRGGRGGRGRGGGGRGTSRGSHAVHHRETGPSVSGTNGTATPATDVTPIGNEWDTGSAEPGAEPKMNGVGTGASDARSTKPMTADTNESAPEGWAASTELPVTSSAAGRGLESAAETPPAPAWATDAGAPDVWASSSTAQNATSDLVKAKAPVKTSKIAPGAKLSWAQIARAQEKPKTVVPPTQPVPSSPVSSPPELTVPVVEEVTLTRDQHQGWEEPTTVQPPTWDDEPPNYRPQAPDSQLSAQDGWITADTVPPLTPLQDTWDTPVSFPAPHQEGPMQGSHWNQSQPDESISVPSPQETTTSITSVAPISSTSSVSASTAPTSKPSTPSVAHTNARPTTTHRNSARYPRSDQAVVIPAFAGSIGTGGEKLGMQFGSLNVGGDDNFDGTFKTETEQHASKAIEQQQAQASTQTQSQDAVQSPIVPASTHSQNIFHQPTPATSSAPSQLHQIQSPPATSQPPPPPPTASGPPFGSHQPPPALSHHHHQQQQQQPQPQSQHSYIHQQQHAIHTHFEGPPAPHQQQQQHAAAPQSGSYFRQPESPYYHNPTPPQSAPPDHPGAYGTTFSPLGVGVGTHTHAQGLGGQGQGGQIGGFGTGGPGEYGYGDGQRGFYDYAQPGSFSNRLIHDEPSKSALPISQGNQPPSSLSSAAGQSQTSSVPQGTSSQPPAGQQGQQQGYPAPMPYYYPPYYPQNSYPTYPNPSYGQAYMPKYPPVYPHQAAVGPGSVPPPTGKGPSAASAPYSASASQNHLYHGQSGFEDPNAGYQHHQGSTNLGSTDYQKQQSHQQQQQPLYGAQAGQGLQGFLGIQPTSGSSQGVGGPGGQQRSGTSPEAAYKPYGNAGGTSDKTGVGIGGQAGQQGRTTGVQQTQQQAGGAGSFYPGGRFSGGAGGPQQQSQQQGQGYPPSGDQSQFYPYQPRHQGGYWQ